MIKRIGFTVVAVLALSMAAQAADMHMHIGTWVLNVAKSTSSETSQRPANDGNVVPRSGGQVISMNGGWLIVKNHGVDKDGKATSQNRILKFDGVARPEIGPQPGALGFLTTGTTIDDFHSKSVRVSIEGKLQRSEVTVVSPDGKSKTHTISRVDRDGKTYNSVFVFDKQ